MSDKICSSADKVLEVFLENAPMDTSHHRMVKQQNKCGYGLQGVCCRLCSNGPCRLSPAKPKGVCGADADTIACRNFLRQVAAGSGCYTHIVENTARRLKEMAQELQAEGKKPKYKDSVAKLAKILQINCCGNCGPDCHNSCAKTAEMIADAVLADIRKPYDEKMTLMKHIALPKRYEVWEKLGILPGGAKDEIFNAVVKTSTNLNSDPMDMLLQCLRLGISTGNYGLILTNLMNDIIMGPPQISMDPVGFRIIDPEYINIMITGHQQSMFADLEEKLESEIVQKSAELVGAKGIRIVGCTCVGQDYQARSGCYKDVYCGHAGNNYTSEAVLMTGCVDLVVGCSNLRAKGHDVFTVELAKELIKKDILVLSAGCTCGGLENCGLMTMDAVELCGEGLKEICTALGVPPVLNFGPCLAIGRIEMAACALAKELNVDLPQLPVVISAPQWLEEQALADGAYALALGFPLHLALSPFVTGSQVAVNVLTEGLKDLTGGQLIIETEVDAAAQKFEDIIKEKRAGLGIDNGINKGGDAIC